MAGNGRPIIPGQMSVETTFADGPLAQPAVVTMPTPGTLKILTIGGLSKVEALAGQIYGRMGACVTAGIEPCESKVRQQLLAEAVDAAEAILAECRRRALAAQENKGTL